MSWSVAITDSHDPHGDLVRAFEAAYPEPSPGVREQFDVAAHAVTALDAAGVVGEAPYTVTVNGYVTQDGEPSTSNSVGLSIVGQAPNTAAEG